ASSVPCGARSSSTMIVMMIAMTPSLNASRRPLPIAGGLRYGGCAPRSRPTSHQTQRLSMETPVKFYNSIGPNPKLVRMFAAEKGYQFAAVAEVDLLGGANRKGPYLEKNPAGQLPSVELDDGRVISETITICELIEETKPTPALIGTNPADRAETRMWVRRVE